MEATTTTDNFGIIMLEWWDNRTGKQLLDEVLPLLTGDGVHLFHPSVLDASPYMGGEFQGEMELWFSFYAPSVEAWNDVIDSIRAKGIRVKEGEYGAPQSIATADSDTMFAWYTDWERLGFTSD
jgi:hypothetical protein